jgi:DNA polymerase-3 subunit beta
MQVRVEQESLAAALRAVTGAVPLRPLTPIEGGVLVSADGCLKLVGGGTELRVECRVSGADVDEPGSLVLPARVTAELVARLGDERLEMVVDETPLQMAFESTRTRARVRGWSAEEFPVGEGDREMARVAVVDGETLRRGIASTAYAASVDAAHELLRGVSVAFAQGEVTLAAADGYRLAVARVPAGDETCEEKTIVVRAPALRTVGRVLSHGEVEVSVDGKGRRARFSSAEVVVTVGLMAGSYPHYRKLMAREWDTAAVVDREQLAGACGTARALSGGMAKLEFSPEGRLGVVVEGGSTGGESDGRIEVQSESEGEGAEALISTLYLSSAVSALPSERVRLRCNREDGTVPLLIEAVEDEQAAGEYKALIMPMLAG